MRPEWLARAQRGLRVRPGAAAISPNLTQPVPPSVTSLEAASMKELNLVGRG